MIQAEGVTQMLVSRCLRHGDLKIDMNIENLVKNALMSADFGILSYTALCSLSATRFLEFGTFEKKQVLTTQQRETL
jgi:hypothetical protein